MARADVRRETAAGRSPEDRLAVWAPPLYCWLCAALWLPVARLPPRPRVRRALIERTCARAYAAFNARVLPVFLSMFDPEVVYDVSQVRDWLDQPMFKCLGRIREMALNWYASWEFSFELRELHDLGDDRCLLLSKFRMTGALRVRSGCWRRPVEGRRGRRGQRPRRSRVR